MDKARALAHLQAKLDMSERFYLKLEEMFPVRPLFPEELRRMNMEMGFPQSGPHSKGPDYRPYCGRAPTCKVMPRMFLIEGGFKCWNCHGEWDLRESRCQHADPSGSGARCPGAAEDLERMPVGIRCRKCAGMHHFDGSPKTEKSIRICVMGCCGRTELPPDACKRCGGQMKEGIAILPEYGGTPEWPGDTIMTVSQVPSKAPPQSCMKCEECGHSYKPGKA